METINARMRLQDFGLDYDSSVVCVLDKDPDKGRFMSVGKQDESGALWIECGELRWLRKLAKMSALKITKCCINQDMTVTSISGIIPGPSIIELRNMGAFIPNDYVEEVLEEVRLFKESIQ